MWFWGRRGRRKGGVRHKNKTFRLRFDTERVHNFLADSKKGNCLGFGSEPKNGRMLTEERKEGGGKSETWRMHGGSGGDRISRWKGARDLSRESQIHFSVGKTDKTQVGGQV